MVLPDMASNGDLNLLNGLYRSYDQIKERNSPDIQEPRPIFGINTPTLSALVTCLRSPFIDMYSRPTYCMQGIAVGHQDKKDWVSALAYLLPRYKTMTDVWREVDVDRADDLEKYALSREISLDALRGTESSTFKSALTEPYPIYESEPVHITFDDSGFEELVRYIASPHVPLVDFVFGATDEMLLLLQSANVIGLIQPKKTVSDQAVGGSQSAVPHDPGEISRSKPAFLTGHEESHNLEPFIPSTKTLTGGANVRGITVAQVQLRQEERSNLISRVLGTRHRFILKSHVGETIGESSPFRMNEEVLDLPAAEAPEVAKIALRNFVKDLSTAGWTPIDEPEAPWWNVRLIPSEELELGNSDCSER